jgi:hypothetical protein
MFKRVFSIALAATLLGGALLGPVPEAGAQAPAAQDSVIGSGVFVEDPCSSKFSCGWGIGIDARSGPSGENPTGSFGLVVITSEGPGPSFTGRVTCLSVEGNRATVGVEIFGGSPGPYLIHVEDNGGAGEDRYRPELVPTVPAQCPPPLPAGSAIYPGDFVVHDALAVPTTKEQCKNGNWRSYPNFKNEGQCVAFVARGPKS